MEYFNIILKKSIDKPKKILYYIQNLMKEVVSLDILFNIFFISFGINIFIVFYWVYSLIEIFLLQSLQGFKLKIKRNQLF